MVIEPGFIFWTIFIFLYVNILFEKNSKAGFRKFSQVSDVKYFTGLGVQKNA